MKKRATKEIKIVSMLVILALLFLFVFNVTYSYFTATASINGNIRFANLQVNFRYYHSDSDFVTIDNSTKIQLAPSESFISRGSAFKLKTIDTNKEISTLGFVATDSASSYLRFWVEAYQLKNINGTYYYVDSKGNFVDDNGRYVNSSGTTITVAAANRGTVIDYGRYFELGTMAADGTFTAINMPKQSKTVNGVTYVTYYYRQQFLSSAYFMNAINFSESAPNELLGTQLGIFLSFDAVQVANNAYLEVFGDANDVRGYYTGWGN